MSPDSPRPTTPTTFTSLESKTSSPANWTEAQKRAYLTRINTKENPQALERLNTLLQTHSPDQLAQLCNEHGHLTYENFADPNALINRFDFTDIENPIADPPLPETKTLLDRDYYFPTIKTIHEIRRLAEMALRGHDIVKEKPELITVEDYRAYFASFHPDILNELIHNLGFIEITKGCNGPCRNICALMPEGPASLSIPFEIVTWLIDESKRLNSETNPGLFYASNMPDYRDGDKTSIDISLYMQDKYDEAPYHSIAYSLAPSTIEWIYQLLQTKSLHLRRISQLTTDAEPEKLLKKLHERAGKDGTCLNTEEEYMIERAMAVGRKNKFNTNAGRAGMKISESELSEQMYSCQNGTVLRAGKGFEGIIMRPGSHLYPKQTLEFPIIPNQKIHTIIPQYFYEGNARQPFQIKNIGRIMLSPKFNTMDNSGNIIKIDEMTSAEENLTRIAKIKRTILDLRPALFVANGKQTSIHRAIPYFERQISNKRDYAFKEYAGLTNFMAKEIGIVCAMIEMELKKIGSNQAAIMDLIITVDVLAEMMKEFSDECIAFKIAYEKHQPEFETQDTQDTVDAENITNIFKEIQTVQKTILQKHPWIPSVLEQIDQNTKRKEEARTQL